MDQGSYEVNHPGGMNFQHSSYFWVKTRAENRALTHSNPAEVRLQ